jgi:hypothetical protein
MNSFFLCLSSLKMTKYNLFRFYMLQLWQVHCMGSYLLGFEKEFIYVIKSNASILHSTSFRPVNVVCFK